MEETVTFKWGNKNDNYNVKIGYIFDNLEGITQKEDNIFRFPIYYIMFI